MSRVKLFLLHDQLAVGHDSRAFLLAQLTSQDKSTAFLDDQSTSRQEDQFTIFVTGETGVFLDSDGARDIGLVVEGYLGLAFQCGGQSAHQFQELTFTSG